MLTDRQIQNLKATGNAYRVREKSTDKTLQGFGVKVTANGVRSFYLEYTFNGKRGNFFTLGKYPALSLVDARDECRQARKLIDHGIDPKVDLERRKVAEEEERRQQAERRRVEKATGTYEDMVAVYLPTIGSAKTRGDAAGVLKRDAAPVLKGKKVTDITPDDIRKAIARPKQRGTRRVPRVLYAYLHAAFQFILGEHEVETEDGRTILFHLERNPVSLVKKPDMGMAPRERVLTVDEIAQVWAAFDAEAGGYSPLTLAAARLVLLTGQRVQEILRASWDQVNLTEEVWTFSREQTKVKRPHLLPLTARAREVLVGLPQKAALIFPNLRRPDAPLPYETVSHAVAEICTKHGIEPFTPRDLRRTCTTHWARLGIPAPTRYLLQNRALTAVEDIHYNMFDGLPEKRAALEKWERELNRILTGVTNNNVIELRA
jgi:integrase